METHSFIDWIAATIPGDPQGELGMIEIASRCTWTKPGEWVSAKGRHGYSYAASHPDGHYSMGGRADMGTHLIVPGNALRGGKVGLLLTGGLLWALTTRNAKFARVDLAIDAIDSDLTVDDLAAATALEDVTCNSRKFNYVQADGGGRCLYIGSRTSERFMRIYNKASELAAKGAKPEHDNWVRIELETKGETANHYGYMLHRLKDINLIVRTGVTNFCDFPNQPEWAKITHGAGGVVAQSHRKLSNRQYWLLHQVARSVASELQSDPSFYARFRRAIKALLA
jgi:hypothetical protein